jgi:hypothetical protein
MNGNPLINAGTSKLMAPATIATGGPIDILRTARLLDLLAEISLFSGMARESQ